MKSPTFLMGAHEEPNPGGRTTGIGPACSGAVLWMILFVLPATSWADGAFEVDVARSFIRGQGAAGPTDPQVEENGPSPVSSGYACILPPFTVPGDGATASAGGEASIRWEGMSLVSRAMYDVLATGAMSGDQPITAAASISAKLYGDAVYTLEDPTAGLPMLVRTSRRPYAPPDPWQAIGLGSGGATISWDDPWRRGPDGSLIRDNLRRDGSQPSASVVWTVAQAGDGIVIPSWVETDGWGSVAGPGSAGHRIDWTEVVDVETMAAPNSADPTASLGRTFVGTKDQFECAYASAAMLLDHWANAYPDAQVGQALWRATDMDYYRELEALAPDDALVPPGALTSQQQLTALNSYLAAAGATDLVAVKLPLTEQNFAGANSIGNPMELRLFPETGAGHSIVVDGLYSVSDPGAPEEVLMDWFSIRDTWSETPQLTTVVQGAESAGEFVGEYRSFMADGREWWPVPNVDEMGQLWVWGPDGDDRNMWGIRDAIVITPREYIRDLRHDTMSAPWEWLSLEGNMRVSCPSPEAIVEVLGLEEDGGNGVLHLFTPDGSPLELVLHYS